MATTAYEATYQGQKEEITTQLIGADNWGAAAKKAQAHGDTEGIELLKLEKTDKLIL